MVNFCILQPHQPLPDDPTVMGYQHSKGTNGVGEYGIPGESNTDHSSRHHNGQEGQ